MRTHSHTLCYSTHCNTLQHTATQCKTLRHNAARCNTLPPVCNTRQNHTLADNAAQHTRTQKHKHNTQQHTTNTGVEPCDGWGQGPMDSVAREPREIESLRTIHELEDESSRGEQQPVEEVGDEGFAADRVQEGERDIWGLPVQIGQ